MRSREWMFCSTSLLISFSLSVTFGHTAVAQTVTNPNVARTSSQRPRAPIGDGISTAPPSPKLKVLKSATRDRAKLAAYNNAAWDALVHQGSCTQPQSTACANDALILAG